MTANLKEIKAKILETKKVIPIEVGEIFQKIKTGTNLIELEVLIDMAASNDYQELAEYLKDLAALKLIEHLGAWEGENNNLVQPDWNNCNVEAMGENSDYPITEEC